MFTSQEVYFHALKNLYKAPDTLATEEQFLEAALQLHAKAGKRGFDLNAMIEKWLNESTQVTTFHIFVTQVPGLNHSGFSRKVNSDQTLEDIFGNTEGPWALYTQGIEIDRKLWKSLKPVPNQEYFFTKVINRRD